MKYLLTFLTFSLLFSQELEIEGDLKVTGTVESATIDSMQAVIDSLKAQIASMQANGNIYSRIYTFNLETYTSDINIHEIIGQEFDWFLLQIVEFSFPNGYSIISSYGQDGNTRASLRNNGYNYSEPTQNIYSEPIVRFEYHNGGDEELNAPVTVLITAQFPN